MQSKWANADSHVHMASKSHWQEPPAGADAGDAGSAAAGASTSGGGGAGALLLNVRLRCIIFLNIDVRRATSLRDAAPQTTNKATAVTDRPVIVLELTDYYC